MKRQDLFRVAEVYKASFCFEKIKPFKETWQEAISFFIETHVWQMANVDVFKVAGTQHPDYQGMTWIEFLRKGKRMPLNLELFEKNPDYYLSPDHKLPTMHYVQVGDGEFYAGRDGEHRTCIAKFFLFLKGFKSLHGVEIDRYRINRRAVRLYARLQETDYYVKPILKKISRNDTPGWMEERFETVFELKDGARLTCDEAEELLRKRALLKKFFTFFGRGR